MAFLLTIISRMQYQISLNNVLNNANVDNTYYLYLYDQYIDEPDKNNAVNKNEAVINKLLSIPEISSVGSIKTLTCKYSGKDSSGHTTAYVYNRDLINNTECALKEGVWFTDYKKKSNVIPAVLSEDYGYKLNDIIVITLQQPSQHGEISNTYKAAVIGILNSFNYLFTFNQGGSMMGLDSLLSKEKAMILPEYAIDASITENAIYTPGKLLFMNNQSEKTKQNIKDLSVGSVTDIKKMGDVTVKDFNRFLISNGLILIVFTMLTLAGIGGNNGLQRIANEKNFSIYYMVGSEWRQCIGIEIWRTAFILGIPYIFFIILYINHALEQFLLTDLSVINIFTFIIIFVYVLGLYAITSLSSILSLARCNPVEVIKRWE